MTLLEGDQARREPAEKEFKEIRIPVINSETGETQDLVLKNQADLDRLIKSLEAQDGEYD